jgi:hypothetical protein
MDAARYYKTMISATPHGVTTGRTNIDTFATSDFIQLERG